MDLEAGMVSFTFVWAAFVALAATMGMLHVGFVESVRLEPARIRRS